MRFYFVPQLGEDFEHLAFQGMVPADDANAGWEVSEVGSVSRVPLKTSGGIAWKKCWSKESLTEPYGT
jgi:hypothetical protein